MNETTTSSSLAKKSKAFVHLSFWHLVAAEKQYKYLFGAGNDNSCDEAPFVEATDQFRLSADDKEEPQELH